MAEQALHSADGRRVVVFGDGQVAELAHYYLSHDSPHEVVAFTVDAGRIKADTFLDLPVVPFEHLVETYPPDRYAMFVAIGYPRVNHIREEKYRQAKAMGYDLITYVSSAVRIWPSTEIGENCFIMEGCVIQPHTRIGNDVVIWAACHIGHHTVIEDHCFLSAHAVISGNTTIEEFAFLGVNASIRNGITIAREGVVGAGVVILRDTQERGVYVAAAPQLLALPSNRLPNL